MKIIHRLLISTFLLLPIISHTNEKNPGWAEEWFNHSMSRVTDRSSHFENQERGFYSAGGLHARLAKVPDQYPLTISLPRLSVGCGGIDLFKGGVSFMSAEMLVRKLQAAVQAAPAIMFDLALKTLSKELSDTLGKFEDIINTLNGLQLDECALAKKAVTYMLPNGPEALSKDMQDLMLKLSVKKGLNESFYEGAQGINSYQAAVDKGEIKQGEDASAYLKGKPKEEIEGCPIEVKNLLSEGSFLENALKLNQNGHLNQQYVELIRGLVGDVYISEIKNHTVPTARLIEPCPQLGENILERFIYGDYVSQSLIKPPEGGIRGVCEPEKLKNNQGMLVIVKGSLNQLAERLVNNIPLSKSDIFFIERTRHIPVYSILKKSMLKNDLKIQVEVMSELVAFNYTWNTIDDLYTQVNTLFVEADKAVQEGQMQQHQNKKSPCNMEIFIASLKHFEQLKQALFEKRQLLWKEYQSQLSAHIQMLQLESLHQQDEINVLKRVARIQKRAKP